MSSIIYLKHKLELPEKTSYILIKEINAKEGLKLQNEGN